MTSSVVPTSQSMFKVIPMSKLSDYDMYKQLGQGTFGVVTKARQKKSNKLVAIKKFIVSDKKEGFPITAFREITIMKKLKNINVLQIVDMIHDDDEDSFFTVSPYISSDLNGLLNNPRIELSLPQIKCIMKQLLLGMDYIHQSGYLHRDIKTANILLDQFGIVKIADFGLARLFHGDPPSCENSPPGGGKYEYTGLVVTRWYRSPELLLGDRKYTTAVDMWGIGCVFAEMFTKRPILEGQSDIHQAEIIFKLLGSPTSENFPNCHLINRHNINLKTNYPRTLEAQFGILMTKDALSLLSGLLTLDPLTRFNAIKCLNSDFFANDPVPCSTEQLSNFEESHESDVKRFKEESKSMKKNPATSYNSSGIELTDKMTSNKGVYKQQTQPITTKNVMSSNINLSMNSASSLNHSRYGVDVEMNREPSVSALADYSVEQDTEDLEKGTMKSALNDDIKNTPIKAVATTGIEIPTKPSDHTADSGNGNNKRTTRLPTNQINQIQSHLHSSNTRGTKRSYESDYRYSKDNDYGYYDPKYGYIDRPLGNSGYYSNRTYDYDGPYFENKRVSGANNRDKSRFEFEQRDNYKGRSNARRMDSSFSASGKELFSSSNTSGSSGLKELSKLMHQKQKQETRKKTEQDEPNGKQTET